MNGDNLGGCGAGRSSVLATGRTGKPRAGGFACITDVIRFRAVFTAHNRMAERCRIPPRNQSLGACLGRSGLQGDQMRFVAWLRSLVGLSTGPRASRPPWASDTMGPGTWTPCAKRCDGAGFPRRTLDTQSKALLPSSRIRSQADGDRARRMQRRTKTSHTCVNFFTYLYTLDFNCSMFYNSL